MVDHECGSTTGYQKGCRLPPCREAHRVDTAKYKRRVTETITPRQRQKLLRDLKRGAPVKTAAERIGVPHQRVYQLARIDEDVHRAVYDIPAGQPVALRTPPARPEPTLRPFTPSLRAAVVDLVRQGATLTAAAEGVGVPVSTVRSRRRNDREFAATLAAARRAWTSRSEKG